MSEATQATERRPRILVVDDDPETAGLVRTWFAENRYEIADAPDGVQGQALAATFQPDLILMDLKMPHCDGITAATQLKSNPETSAIPIVLLTACRDLNAKVQAFRAGADDYITKPFEFEEMDERIQMMLERRGYLNGLESRVQALTASNEQLEKLLMVDEKTGLYNFRAFQRRLTEEWERATRYNVPLSLVFLDLDKFKNINDTMGHQAGDGILREFAMLMTGGARANDVAARYGGEEFAVILPHTDGAMATRVAERICSAVREFVFLASEQPTRVTVSAGVATFPSSLKIDSVDALIREADTALYAAKDGGRDQVIRAGSDVVTDDPPRNRRAGDSPRR